MKRIFFCICVFFSRLLDPQLDAQNIIEKNGGVLCQGAYYGESLTAPKGMLSYLWHDGSTKDATRVITEQSGEQKVWCVINQKDTLKSVVWVVPYISGNFYVATQEKSCDSLILSLGSIDTTTPTNIFEVHWYNQYGDSIGSKNQIKVFDSGEYWAEIKHPCTPNPVITKKRKVEVQPCPTTNSSDITVPQILVYPNPTSDVINITNESGSEIEIEIFTILGQKIDTFSEIGNFQKNISNYKPGIYLLKTNSQVIKFEKL